MEIKTYKAYIYGNKIRPNFQMSFLSSEEFDKLNKETTNEKREKYLNILNKGLFKIKVLFDDPETYQKEIMIIRVKD